MPKAQPPFETLSAEAQALYDAVNNEPDLPCVLIVSSFLDQCLASLLTHFLIEDRVSQGLVSGALGRMRVRAEMAYALGLIPASLMKNLTTVAEIRNEFAHSYLTRSFEEARIKDLCNELAYPAIANSVRVDGQTGEVTSPADPWERFFSPRSRFTIASVMMASRLMLTGLGVERRAEQVKGWS